MKGISNFIFQNIKKYEGILATTIRNKRIEIKPKTITSNHEKTENIKEENFIILKT